MKSPFRLWKFEDGETHLIAAENFPAACTCFNELFVDVVDDYWIQELSISLVDPNQEIEISLDDGRGTIKQSAEIWTQEAQEESHREGLQSRLVSTSDY